MEVGGRWSREAHTFVRDLALAKARSEPSLLRRRAALAWWARWRSVLAVAAARAFALSLLERRAGTGSDGDLPVAAQVLADARYVPGDVES